MDLAVACEHVGIHYELIHLMRDRQFVLYPAVFGYGVTGLCCATCPKIATINSKHRLLEAGWRTHYMLDEPKAEIV
jgi:hypothetical protein